MNIYESDGSYDEDENKDQQRNSHRPCSDCPPPCPEPSPCPDGGNHQKQCQRQGDQFQTQGDQAAAQGAQTQTQGDLAETQGDQAAAQGAQTQTQGDLSESLGDMTQSQGGETQGSQTQGDQTQSITGHGGQTQGDQTQSMSGHGDQTQGDQTLSSNPAISTPVSVSGVNVNVTVTCGECKKPKEDGCCSCRKECRESIAALLYLIKTLASAITDPTASAISFYFLGMQGLPTVGNLGSVTDCLFTIVPEAAGNEITVSTDALEAVSFAPVATTPNLFSLLLNYLVSLPMHLSHPDDGKGCGDSMCDCCFMPIRRQLQDFYFAKALLKIDLAENSFTGYIYRISNGIVFLVDDLASPTILYAIPICKIRSYQPQ